MRTDILNPDEYFMGVAMITAKRSRDPQLQVGACVVDKAGLLRSVGYNGMPKNNFTAFPWTRTNVDKMEEKRLYECHAEENAIIPYPGSLQGCSIYVTHLPCNQCAKIIVQSGIKEVIYKDSFKDAQTKYQASRRLFQKCGVFLRQYIPTGYTLSCKL